jgi:hypothetical protein
MAWAWQFILLMSKSIWSFSVLVYGKFVFRETCSVYEIYPQSETPRLTRIAHLVVFDPPMWAFLLPRTVIWCYSVMDRIVLRVWDYRLNHSISFSVVVNNFDYKPEVYFIPSKGPKLASNSFVGR